MSQRQSRKSPISITHTKQRSSSGMLPVAGSSSRGALYTRTPSHDVTEESSEKVRKDALHDLAGLIIVGPPNEFPVKPSTGRAMFDLAVDCLARHDKTTADALLRYAAQFGRLELLGLHASIEGLSPDTTDAAIVKWLLEPSLWSTNDLQNDFPSYRRAVGKRACHLRTLRRQYELLRTYGRTHKYPAGPQSRRIQRMNWVREHLLGMITAAQCVPCWHQQENSTAHEQEKLLSQVDEKTSIAALSAMVLSQLHPKSADYLLKRLLPPPRKQ